MTQIKWIRRLLRRRMTPIDESVASKWSRRLSIAYGLLAWNAFGVVIYYWSQGKLDLSEYYGLKSEEDQKMTNKEYFARNIGREGATVRLINIKGFSVTEDREYVLEKSKPKPDGSLPTTNFDLKEVN